MRKVPFVIDVCHYCPAPATTRDHIVPLAVGGPNCADNLVASCEPCNQRKGSSKPTCDCARCVDAVRKWWYIREEEHLTQRIVIPGYDTGVRSVPTPPECRCAGQASGQCCECLRDLAEVEEHYDDGVDLWCADCVPRTLGSRSGTEV